MASIFRPKGRKKYIIEYFDENGRRRKKTGATDKAVTERIARELENRVALRREGVIDARDDAYRDHEARTILAHLDDWKAALLAKGSSEKHAKVSHANAGRVLKASKARRISDLSLSRVEGALAVLRAEGRGPETMNHHVRAVKAFARWLWKDGRARDHRLAHLSTVNPESDRRRVRRALTADEAARLVGAAERGGIVQGIAGPDRAMAYRVALGTGFRAGELASLTPESFRLAASPPLIVCKASYTKNGHVAEQPISDALAALLRPYVALKPPGRPVFPLTDRAAEMLRVDLDAAGIPDRTDEGVIDFHALRATYVSQLVASGASVKACQTLARHSTPSLTIGVYAKASLHDLAGAVSALPDLTTPPASEAARATGTDGRPAPTATQSATTVPGDEPQTLRMQSVGGDPACDLKSPGGEPPCGFDSHRRHHDSSRLGLTTADRTTGLRRERSIGIDEASRQFPPASAHSCPPTATKSATTIPPDLGEIIDAWPSLPEAIRAGILAMVRASRAD